MLHSAVTVQKLVKKKKMTSEFSASKYLRFTRPQALEQKAIVPYCCFSVSALGHVAIKISNVNADHALPFFFGGGGEKAIDGPGQGVFFTVLTVRGCWGGGGCVHVQCGGPAS